MKHRPSTNPGEEAQPPPARNHRTQPSAAIAPHRVKSRALLSAFRNHLVRRLAAVFLLLALTCAAYWTAGGDEFFFDSLQLTQDPALTDWNDSWSRFSRTWFRFGQQLTDLTFAANHRWNTDHGLPGFHAASFIRVNVLIHAANVCLLFVLMCMLANRNSSRGGFTILPCLLCAALFAVHPLHVSSVCYVVQRRGLLVAFFYLLALITYLRLRAASTALGRVALALALAGLFALALKSRTAALTLPFALVALEFCLAAGDPTTLRRFLRRLVPLVGVGALASFVVLFAAGLLDFSSMRLRGMGSAAAWGPWEQCLTQMRVLARSWLLILAPWPAWLSLDHPFSISQTLWEGGAIGCVVLHAVLIACAILAARRGQALLAFGVVLFYVSALTWLFIPQTEQLVEYKTYLGAAGLCLIACQALIWITKRGSHDVEHQLTTATHPARAASLVPGHAAATAMLAAIVVLFIFTTQRCRLFRDPVALWTDVLQKSPGNFRAHVSLGDALARANRPDDSLAAYRNAVRIEPHNAFLHYMIGNAHRQAGRFTEAVDAYRRAREIAGGDLYIYVNLADALSRLGRHDQAIVELRLGIDHANPDTDAATRAKASFNLGNSLAALGRNQEAADAYSKAIQHQPGHANAHYGLGLMLQAAGRIDEAIAAYEACLRGQPDHAACRHALQTAMETRRRR